MLLPHHLGQDTQGSLWGVVTQAPLLRTPCLGPPTGPGNCSCRPSLFLRYLGPSWKGRRRKTKGRPEEGEVKREGRRKSKHRGGRGRGSERKKAQGVSETARCCSHHIATSSHGLVQPCSTEKETEVTWVETGPAGLGFAPGYPDECPQKVGSPMMPNVHLVRVDHMPRSLLRASHNP